MHKILLSILYKLVVRTCNDIFFREITKNNLTKLDGLSFKTLSNLQTLKLKKNSISAMSDAAFFGLHKLQIL